MTRVYAPGSDTRGSATYQPSSGSGGVFAQWLQGATPKYAKNRGFRSDLFRDTLARLAIRVTEADASLFRTTIADSHVREQLLDRVAGDPRGHLGYVDFLVQQFQLSLSEFVQVTPTLGDNFVTYAFGAQPVSIPVQGFLLNTVQDDQATNFVRLYLELFRATQLARRQKALSLKVDAFIFTGAMTNLVLNYEAKAEGYVPFSFNFLVKKIAIVEYTVGWRPTGVGTPFATDLNAVPADARIGNDRAATAVTLSLPSNLSPAEERAQDARVQQTPPVAASGDARVSLTGSETVAQTNSPRVQALREDVARLEAQETSLDNARRAYLREHPGADQTGYETYRPALEARAEYARLTQAWELTHNQTIAQGRELDRAVNQIVDAPSAGRAAPTPISSEARAQSAPETLNPPRAYSHPEVPPPSQTGYGSTLPPTEQTPEARRSTEPTLSPAEQRDRSGRQESLTPAQEGQLIDWRTYDAP